MELERNGSHRKRKKTKTRPTAVPKPFNSYDNTLPCDAYYWMWLGAMRATSVMASASALPFPFHCGPTSSSASSMFHFPSTSSSFPWPIFGASWNEAQSRSSSSHRKRRKLNPPAPCQDQQQETVPESSTSYDVGIPQKKVEEMPVNHDEEEQQPSHLALPIHSNTTNDDDGMAEDWVLDEQLAAMFARTEARRRARRERDEMQAEQDPHAPADSPHMQNTPSPSTSVAVPLGVHSHSILQLKGRLENAMRIHGQQAPMWPKEPLFCT
jgi:hypothetical protein